MTSSKIAFVISCLLLPTTFAAAQPFSIPINTGYNYAGYGPYPPVTVPTSITNDDYWINIASYPVTGSAVKTAFVLESTPWPAPLLSSNWIGSRNSVLSDPTTNPSNPAYTIFRKCFCLAPNVIDPRITFDARVDDNLQVWLNTQVQVLLPPQLGSIHSGGDQLLHSSPSNPVWFHVGLNCIYALVEDTFNGATAFNLAGTIQGAGSAPQVAFGVTQTFACQCNTAAHSETPPELNGHVDNDDSEVVAALVQIAEERRLSRTRLVPISQHH